MARDESAQKEGSDCVTNCSDKGKKDSIVPADRASLKSCLPLNDENGINVEGRVRP